MKGLVCFRHGLSANTVEKLLRIGLAYALSQMMGLRDLTPKMRGAIDADIESNVRRLQDLDPTSPWVCHHAAAYECSVNNDTWQAMQGL